MRNLILVFFTLLSLSVSAQITHTSGVPHRNNNPVEIPTSKGSRIQFNMQGDSVAFFRNSDSTWVSYHISNLGTSISNDTSQIKLVRYYTGGTIPSFTPDSIAGPFIARNETTNITYRWTGQYWRSLGNTTIMPYNAFFPLSSAGAGQDTVEGGVFRVGYRDRIRNIDKTESIQLIGTLGVRFTNGNYGTRATGGIATLPTRIRRPNRAGLDIDSYITNGWGNLMYLTGNGNTVGLVQTTAADSTMNEPSIQMFALDVDRRSNFYFSDSLFRVGLNNGTLGHNQYEKGTIRFEMGFKNPSYRVTIGDYSDIYGNGYSEFNGMEYVHNYFDSIKQIALGYTWTDRNIPDIGMVKRIASVEVGYVDSLTGISVVMGSAGVVETGSGANKIIYGFVGSTTDNWAVYKNGLRLRESVDYVITNHTSFTDSPVVTLSSPLIITDVLIIEKNGFK